MITYYLNRFLDVQASDPHMHRRARNLNILITCIVILSLITGLAVFIVQRSGGYTRHEAYMTYNIVVANLVLMTVIYIVNKKYSSTTASIIFLSLLTAVSFLADTPYQNIWGQNMIVISIPILMASVILPSYTSFIMAAIICTLLTLQAVNQSFPINIIGIITFFAAAFVSWFSAHSLEIINQDLRKSKEKAEAATTAKTQFLANMSHEIRTPLNGVIGMGDVLADTAMTNEQQEFLQVMRNSSISLLNIIDDILDYSKIERNKLILENAPFNLRQCIEDAIDFLTHLAAQKGVELIVFVEPTVPSLVIGDMTRLRQILVNLIGNAIKYTEHGEVVLTVEEVEKTTDNSSLKFTIRDTGIGIPPDAFNLLFEPFAQADNTMSRRFGGSGLGLAISKQIVKLMGGRIWLQNTGAAGSIFAFSVTYPKIETPVAPFQSNQQPVLSAKRLLVVDDNVTNCELLAKTCRYWGMAVDTAGDGEDTLAKLQENGRFDFILIDWEMPGMDGLSLAKKIKDTPKMKATPLVLLAPLGKQPEEAQKAWFVDRLTKPLKTSQLYETLETVLKNLPKKNPSESYGVLFDNQMAEQYPLRILLVEDNKINQKVALNMLKRLGYQASVAENGRLALDALEQQDFDLIFMDIQMPEMDGLEATKQIIQRYPKSERPYIAALTANAMKGDREMYLAYGMDDYISKPVTIKDLVNVLKKCSQKPNGLPPQ